MPEYRIIMRKHQYSASVCAKSVLPIVPKFNYMVQYFMLFLLHFYHLQFSKHDKPLLYHPTHSHILF